MTFYKKKKFFIRFLDLKNPLKMISLIIILIFIFLVKNAILHIFFDPMGQKLTGIELAKIGCDLVTL